MGKSELVGGPLFPFSHMNWSQLDTLLITCLITGTSHWVSDYLCQCGEKYYACRNNEEQRKAHLDFDEEHLAELKKAGLEVKGEQPEREELKDDKFEGSDELLALRGKLDTEWVGWERNSLNEPDSSKHCHGYRPEKPISHVRAFRFGMAIGFLWGGPTSFLRFSFVNMVFTGKGMAAAAGKMSINQFVFSPILHGGVLLLNEWGKVYSEKGFLGGFKAGWEKLKVSLLEVQLVTWCTKVPLNFFCFWAFETVPMQVLFMRTYDIFFYIYLSYISDREDTPERIAKKKAELDADKEYDELDDPMIKQRQGGRDDELDYWDEAPVQLGKENDRACCCVM